MVDGIDTSASGIAQKMMAAKKQADAAIKDLLDKAKGDPRVAQAQAALGNMKDATAQLRSQRRAQAAAKVERLKQELQMLRQMCGDPKQVARAAARIARELAAAAKEYAAAGGAPQPPAESEAATGIDKIKAQAAEIERRGAELDADHKFAAEVRGLFAQARSLVEQQRRRAQQDKGKDGELDRLSAEVADAGRGIDQALGATGDVGPLALPLDV